MRTGKVSDSVLKRSVLKQIRYKRREVASGAGIGEDCAIFASGGGFASAVSQTDIRETADMARALIRAANSLATSGACPVAAQIVLLLPPDAEERQLRELMESAEEVCCRMEMQIAGGHTAVSPHVDCPLACVTAYGTLESPGLTTRGARPGQDIVLTKWIGLEGTAVLARRERERLLERCPAWLVEEAAGFDRWLSVVPEAAVAVKSGVLAMHDASEGGILAALWELAESSGVGLAIDLRRIPIRQETVEVCERCGINPYALASSGCLIAAADHGESLAEQFAREKIPAAVIGQITEGRDRLVYNGEEKRYLDKPAQDEIYKT